MSKRTIYLLQDPTTLEPKYVGRTERPLKARLKAHLYERQGTPKYEWVARLRSQGLVPVIQELEVLNWGVNAGDYTRDAESFWISYFRFLGAELLNTHQKVSTRWCEAWGPKPQPSLDHVGKLGAALGVPAGYFLKGV